MKPYHEHRLVRMSSYIHIIAISREAQYAIYIFVIRLLCYLFCNSDGTWLMFDLSVMHLISYIRSVLMTSCGSITREGDHVLTVSDAFCMATLMSNVACLLTFEYEGLYPAHAIKIDDSNDYIVCITARLALWASHGLIK